MTNLYAASFPVAPFKPTDAQRKLVWEAVYDEAGDMSQRDVAELIFDGMSDEDIADYLNMMDEEQAEAECQAEEEEDARVEANHRAARANAVFPEPEAAEDDGDEDEDDGD